MFKMTKLYESIQEKIIETTNKLDARGDAYNLSRSEHERDLLLAKLSMYQYAASACQYADSATDAGDRVKVFRNQMQHEISYIRFSMKSWGIVIDENNKMYNSAKIQGSIEAYRDVMTMANES